jgi:hypothetical protein
LPRFSWILAKLEPDFMGKITELDGPRSAETVQIIRAEFIDAFQTVFQQKVHKIHTIFLSIFPQFSLS